MSILIMMVGINLIIEIASAVAKVFVDRLATQKESKSKERSEKISKLLKKLGNNYGIRFFLVVIRSISIELILFASLSLVYTDSTIEIWIGWVVSLCLVAFIVWMGISAWLLAKNIQSIPKIQELISTSNVQTNLKTVDKLVNLKILPYAYLDFFFEKVKVCKSTWRLSFCIMDISRAILIPFVVLTFERWPKIQCSLALTVECLYLAYLFWSDSLSSKVHKWYIVYFHGTHIVYIALKISTMNEMSDHIRQQVIGLIMFFLLFQLIITELVACVCLVVNTLFGYFKAIVTSRKKVDEVIKKQQFAKSYKVRTRSQRREAFVSIHQTNRKVISNQQVASVDQVSTKKSKLEPQESQSLGQMSDQSASHRPLVNQLQPSHHLPNQRITVFKKKVQPTVQSSTGPQS